MFQTLRNAWKIADLRKKLLFTLFIVVIFRIGCHIPVPFIDHAAVKSLMESYGAGNLLGYMNMLSGGALSQATIFALSISPYITAQIIVQLLTIAIPALERMSKNGEEGRKQIVSLVESNKPFMVGRYGTSEGRALAEYYEIKYGHRKDYLPRTKSFLSVRMSP